MPLFSTSSLPRISRMIAEKKFIPWQYPMFGNTSDTAFSTRDSCA
ncbi:MAG: hypothetical protein P4M11_12925 [Candidatus Pacebacteria bacterium]|nr:hypothetical protein [Candidatus Paceibacterota bacterium]